MDLGVCDNGTQDNDEAISVNTSNDCFETGRNLDDDEESPFFEDILKKLGATGKFQMIQCALCILPMLSVVYSDLGFVFTGYTPSHVCKEINETMFLERYGLQNDSTAQVSYGQCDITLSSNQTGSSRIVETFTCPNGRHFPEGKYMTMVSEWDLVCEKTGLPEVVMLVASIGGVLGGLTVPVFADRFGRKPVLCIAAIVTVIVDMSMAFSPNVYYVFFGFFIVGMMTAAVDATYLVLGMEMLIPHHRQVYGAIICSQYWVVCTLTIGLVAYLLQDAGWRYVQGTCALLTLMSLATPFFLYESTQWLVAKGRSGEALKILKKASQKNGKPFIEVNKTFQAYVISVQRKEHQKRREMKNLEQSESVAVEKMKSMNSNTNRSAIVSMLFNRKSIGLLLIMWYMWTTCNLTYFGVYMSSSELAGNRFLNYSLMALVEVPCNFTVQFMMRRMGRLQIVRIFIGLAAISFLVSLSLTFVNDDVEHFGAVSTMLFIVGKFTVSCFFTVIYIYTPETIPTAIRSTVSGSCRSIPLIGFMLATYIRPLYSVAKWGPSLIFFSVCFVAFLLSFRLPESKDRTLPTDFSDLDNRKRNKVESHNC